MESIKSIASTVDRCVRNRQTLQKGKSLRFDKEFARFVSTRHKKKMCKKWKDINQLSENWCRSKSAQCALTHKASKQAESVITNNFRASRISKRIIQRGLQHKKYEPNQTKWRADIYVRMPVCECTACVYVWHVTNPQMQSRCFAIIIYDYDICHPVWNERER